MLIIIQAYQKLMEKHHKNIIDLLAMPGVEDIPFEPARLGNKTHKPAEFD